MLARYKAVGLRSILTGHIALSRHRSPVSPVYRAGLAMTSRAATGPAELRHSRHRQDRVKDRPRPCVLSGRRLPRPSPDRYQVRSAVTGSPLRAYIQYIRRCQQ